jgi:NAD+ synthase
MLRDPEKTKNEIIAWIQKYFEENGPSCTAVIGISGGKDSSVAAALCAQALGKDRVLGVLMPNGVQSDISDSRLLVESIGIPYVEMNIGEAYNAMEKMLSTNADLKKIAGTDEMAREAKINLAPRLRMSTLYAVGQMLPQGGRVVNTCNMSEDYVGYSTKYGDAAGDFSPLSGLMVHEVLQVGACLGLPEQLVQKTPSDGLSGLSDEDKLGFTYAELDHYILTGVCENEEHKKKIDRLHRLNMHKLRLLPRYEPAEDADRRDISKW